MKVHRYFASTLGVTALACATVFGGASAATAVAAKPCKATIAIMAPITGAYASLGVPQLDFAELAVANDNKSLGTNVTLNQDDTQLNPSIAVTKAQSIIASNAVGVVGPSGSQEVLATGKSFATAGLALVSPSATNVTLTQPASGFSTFFRVVPTDAVQGPTDANFVIKQFHPKAVLIVEDQEAYSTGLGTILKQVLSAKGVKVNVQSFNGTDTGTTLASDISSLVTGQLNASETVTIMPDQKPQDPQLFAQDATQQGKKTIVLGTDGTYDPTNWNVPGNYVSIFTPDISTSKSPFDEGLLKGVKKYGPYNAFGVPAYAATDVLIRAIASVCKSGGTPSRANVLAAVKKTNIPVSENPLGVDIKFSSHGDLEHSTWYLDKINAKGQYVGVITSS
jgi:branched-chain amino acid transport system substrate-binding protein